ncbi:MAG: J domain-containing protein [Leptonema illini]|jgi:hypothetical protein|uniref:J domain-containing protein n=1 Tax=Leptonema illini TaxID=183 RepID=A0A833H4P5_9LEPT|nr:MAG: J domain-containing protein [Leptonema illini]PKL32795.1 MAG: hypothetical protein CVV45_10875 [Spirochaetae bacterium HGW-Spirochaetae-10]
MVEPLPESNDPYRLLGVTRNDDRQAVKQAYARLIRQYKPEKHPAEFQRIRQAYERILSFLDGTSQSFILPTGFDLSPAVSFRQFDSDIEKNTEELIPQEKKSLEALLDGDDADGAARFFLENLTHPDLIDSILSFASNKWPETFLRCLRTLSWNELRRNPNPLAAELLRIILAQSCLDGSIDRLITEMKNIHLHKDSIDHFFLENLIFRMKVALTLPCPKMADGFEIIPGNGIDDEVIEELFIRQKISPRWSRLMLLGGMPERMKGYFLAAPLFSPDERIRHAALLGQSAKDYIKAMHHPDVSYFLEWEMEILLPLLDNRLPEISDADPEQYRVLDDEIKDLPAERALHVALVIAFVLGVSSTILLQWWSAPVWITMGGLLYLVVKGRDRAIYSRIQERIFQMILTSGADPLAVAGMVSRHEPRMKRLKRYAERIRKDRVLKIARAFFMAGRATEFRSSRLPVAVEPPYRFFPSVAKRAEHKTEPKSSPETTTTQTDSGSGFFGFWGFWILIYVGFKLIQLAIK